MAAQCPKGAMPGTPKLTKRASSMFLEKKGRGTPSSLSPIVTSDEASPVAPPPTKGWAALASVVSTNPNVGNALTNVVRQAADSVFLRNMAKLPSERTAVDIKFIVHYLLARSSEWSFLRSKPVAFFEPFAKVARLVRLSAGDTVFEEGDDADSMFVCVEGCVTLSSTSPSDEDTYVPLDWAAVKRDMSIVQASLDAMKVIADVATPGEIPAIKKPEAADAPDPDSDGDEVKDGKFDARKTWGRVFGGIKLAAILATAVEEFVDKGAKRAAKLAETHFVLNVAKGDSFGEPGLLQRKPRRMATAKAKKDAILLVLPRENYLSFNEANLMAVADESDLALLSSLSWATGLPEDILTRLAVQAKKIDIPPGQVIVQEGEVSTVMYIIKEGDVNVTVSSKSSGTPSGFARRQLFNLGVISRGQWFGERPLLTGEKNDFTYTTATRTTVIAIGLKLFSQIRRKVGSTLLRELTAKLEHRSQRLGELVSMSRAAAAAAEARRPPPVITASGVLPAGDAPYTVTHKHSAVRLQVRRDWEEKPSPLGASGPPGTMPSPLTTGQQQKQFAGLFSPKPSRPLSKEPIVSSPSLPLDLDPRSPSATIRPQGYELASSTVPLQSPSVQRPLHALFTLPMSKPSTIGSFAKGPLPTLEPVDTGKKQLQLSPMSYSRSTPSLLMSPPATLSGASKLTPLTITAPGLSPSSSTKPGPSSSQVHPLQQFVSPLPRAHTGAYTPTATHLLSASNSRLRLPEFGEGTVGAGRSAVASPYSRKAKAKDARGLDNTANETRSPVKASDVRGSPSGVDAAGDILQSPLMHKTRELVSSLHGQPPPAERDFTPAGDAGLLRRIEKQPAQRMKRKALKLLGIQH